MSIVIQTVFIELRLIACADGGRARTFSLLFTSFLEHPNLSRDVDTPQIYEWEGT